MNYRKPITFGILILTVLGTAASAFADLKSCLPLGPGDSKHYPVFEMSEKFIEKDVTDGVIYIPADKQFTLKPTIENGQFVIPPGFYQPNPSGSHVMMYVMNARGEIFWKPAQTPGIKHSSLLAGAPVACAGHIVVKDGKVLYVTTSSGHYKPGENQIRAVLDSLYRQGFDLSRTKLVFGGNKTNFVIGENVSPFSALAYLFHTPESQRCVKERLKDASLTTAHDIRDLRGISRAAYDTFLKDAHAQGRIPFYGTALRGFFHEDAYAYKNAPAGVVKALGPIDPDFCARLLRILRLK